MKIGIDLGGSHVAIGLIDDNYEIVEKRTYYMSNKNEETLENYILSCIVSGINEILNSTNFKLTQIESIGIATPGEPKGGIIKNAVNLGIKEFNIEEQLNKVLGQNSKIQIKIGNDAKCAALAEKHKGSLREYKDCVFLCIGTGIGGAAFMNNVFLKPARNSGFEFGHIIIKKDGKKCNCGNNGCFEAYCSKREFKKEMQRILGIEEYIGAKELTQKINENINNRQVKNLLEEYIENLEIGISNIINILEPQAICIGGSISHYDELILDKLRERIYNGKYLFNKEEPPKILAATEGNDAGIIGATLL